jgi:hypothetical protein
LDREIRRIVDAARGVWTCLLIDHLRANSLLFFHRVLKVSTTDLTAETEVVSRLLAGGQLTVESLVSADRYVVVRSPGPFARRKRPSEDEHQALMQVARRRTIAAVA